MTASAPAAVRTGRLVSIAPQNRVNAPCCKLAHFESHISAGTTLSAALFEYAIDTAKVALIDLGTGDQSYKADWMETTRARYCIDCLNPAKPRARPSLAKRLPCRIGAPDARSLAPDARRG
jgi:hypothetical protein